MFRIEPKYYIYEEAPLKWFDFVRHIQCFLGLIVLAVNIFGELSRDMSFYLYYAPLLLVIWAAELVVVINAIYGLNMREWAGVKAYLWVYGMQMLEAVHNMFLTVAYGMYDTSAGLSLIGNSIGKLIPALVFLVLNYIYFEKRRPLFTPAITYEMTATEPLSDTTEESNETEGDGLQNNMGNDARDSILATENAERDHSSEGDCMDSNPYDATDEQLADRIMSTADEVPKQEVLIHVTGKTGKSAWVPESKAKMWLLAEENAYNNIMRMNSEHPENNAKKEHEVEAEVKAAEDVKKMAVMPELPEVRFCYHCGYRVLEDAIYCEKCGAKIR